MLPKSQNLFKFVFFLPVWKATRRTHSEEANALAGMQKDPKITFSTFVCWSTSVFRFCDGKLQDCLLSTQTGRQTDLKPLDIRTDSKGKKVR